MSRLHLMEAGSGSGRSTGSYLGSVFIISRHLVHVVPGTSGPNSAQMFLCVGFLAVTLQVCLTCQHLGSCCHELLFCFCFSCSGPVFINTTLSNPEGKLISFIVMALALQEEEPQCSSENMSTTFPSLRLIEASDGPAGSGPRGPGTVGGRG